MVAGLIVLLLAGILQGIFVLPLTFTKNWKWEHGWLMFSFWGMIILNWLLALYLFPQVFSIYRQVPFTELFFLFLFGLCWGIGAILFGLGMEKLGMSVGYPVIMGLVAGTGTLVPLLLKKPESVFTLRGFGVILGCGLVILGILICSKASNTKNQNPVSKEKEPEILTGIMIAVSAGLLSALPNIGMSFATQTIHQAIIAGITPDMAGNLVWLLFFSVGFLANAAYTIFLMIRYRSVQDFIIAFSIKNVVFSFLAAACWIGSFYLYGYSASMLGSFGAIIGWPVFISIAIVTGNMAGIWKGEWKNATPRSIQLLKSGMTVFILAVILIGLSNFL
jgi:L-rhamnose-H+ transport protein